MYNQSEIDKVQEIYERNQLHEAEKYSFETEDEIDDE